MDKLERWSAAMVKSPCANNCDVVSPIDTAKNIINWWLLSILLIWLILWTYLIYRKYKWEKWLRKKFFKRNLIYIFIILVLFIGISFLFWYIEWPFASVGAIPFEN